MFFRHCFYVNMRKHIAVYGNEGIAQFIFHFLYGAGGAERFILEGVGYSDACVRPVSYGFSQ